jgi:hypothetical protein
MQESNIVNWMSEALILFAVVSNMFLLIADDGPLDASEARLSALDGINGAIVCLFVVLTKAIQIHSQVFDWRRVSLIDLVDLLHQGAAGDESRIDENSELEKHQAVLVDNVE